MTLPDLKPSIGRQQAIMGAAGFEKKAATPLVLLAKEPTLPGVFVNLPDIGQQQEEMGHYGRLRQARVKAEAAAS